MYAVFASAVVTPLVLDGGNGYARLLSTAPIVWLGEISYEIFLLHVIVMEVASASVLQWRVFTGSMSVLFALTLLMSVPLAWLLHRWTWARLVARAAPGSASRAATLAACLERPPNAEITDCSGRARPHRCGEECSRNRP